MIPVAIGVGLAGAATARGPVGQLVFGGGTALVAALWGLGRRRRPVLLVDDQGYRVEERGREKLRVAFREVKRVRAVPAEQAMYIDCGAPARNLLLPTRHGYGFRFARQPELYVLLAQHLGDRVEIVETLIPPESPKPI